jgi:hypothetical protein
MEFITNKIEGHAAVEDGKWDDIEVAAAKHRRSRITVENWTEEREWSDRQRKWWKGVLLPSLAESTGDSLAYWENKLKLAVLPDDFKPIGVQVDVSYFFYLPSITTLGIKKMNIMVEGSVAHLRDEKIYGDVFHWVTLPDRDLRKA